MHHVQRFSRIAMSCAACIIMSSIAGVLAQTPTVTATKVDSVIDLQGNSHTGAGDSLKYIITIQNSGTGEATGVGYGDTPDANTTLVPGSVRTTPIARNDSYEALSTQQLVVPASGVLANDNDPDGTGGLAAIAQSSAATTQGGTVTLATDGSFTYDAPSSVFSGTDDFQYVIQDADGNTDNATAYISVTPPTPPDAVDDSPVATSSPGDAFHTALNTTLNSASAPNTPSVLANDDLGTPAGTLTTFGGGDLGGAVTDHIAGTAVPFGTGGSLQVNADGEFIFTPSSGFVGLFSFQYRLANAPGTDDATVTIGVGVRPQAVADAFSATGNIAIAHSTGKIFANNGSGTDLGDQISVTQVQGVGGNVGVATATNQSGRGSVTGFATLNADGSFTYEPPPGFEGNDTFTYTVGNGFGNSSSATVTITVGGMVWFISNNAGGNNRGTFNDPFTSIASFNTANAATGSVPDPKNGDRIALRTGNGTYAEVDGINLRNSQILVGEAVQFNTVFTANANSITAYNTFAAGTMAAPVITASAGNGVDLASGNSVRGLNVGNTSGFKFNGSAVGSLTINTVNALGNGGALNVSTSGSFGSNVTFSTLSSTNAAAQAINLVGVTGTLSVTSGSISNPTGTAINVSGGSVSMTYPGGITQNNNATTVAVSNGHTGTLTFQTGTISVTNGNGLQFDNADGTYSFNGTTTLNGGDAGIDILSGSSGTFTFGSTTSISRANGVSGAAFSLVSSDANVTYNGSMTLGTSTGNMVAINNHDAGTMNFNTGNLSKGSSTTQGISIQNCNGGTINFNNPTIGITMTTGSAVSLTSNSGAAINFTPAAGGNGMDLSTTSGTGFNATGGGTITVTGAGNTITSTTGTALNVASTTIGAGNLNFQSISSSGGSATGIILDNTGTSGGLIVNGDGTNTTQGGNSSGGTISNKTGADGATTTGCGIYLNDTKNVVLRRMTINGTIQNHGIRGFLVNGFTLEYSTVNGTLGTSAAYDNYGEGAVYFGDDASTSTNGLTGSATVTSCVFGGGRARNFSVVNTAGTLNRLTITNSNFGLNQNFVDAGDNLSIEARNSGTVVNATVTGCTMTGAPQDLFEFVGQTLTTTDLIFQNNTLSNSHAQNIIGGGGVTIATQGAQTFNCSGNTLRDANGSAITLQKASAGTSMSGTINNNTIGVSGVAGSGSATGNGIFCSFAGGGTITMAITNNVIRRYNGNAGIYADNTGGNYAVNLTITGNTTAEPGGGAFAGLALAAGAPSSSDDIDVCANITGNDFSAGDPANANDVILGVSTSASSIRLPGYAGASLAAVQSFVLGNNNVAGTVVTAYVDPPATAANFTGGAACTTP